ncbi:hypothetical protein [Lacinutrix sp. Bg11-31]|uniref:hypothetical protein n=1 Tax=Lacinutrix sp. Bg11-31 TaxID=2057808 RepID=UPI0012FE1C15|nr:hypothetical protein [Lacinutrix sp. Bg11-31]
MRIILFLFTALFMSANFTSCTPTSLIDSTLTEQGTIGDDDGEILPEEAQDDDD